VIDDIDLDSDDEIARQNGEPSGVDIVDLEQVASCSGVAAPTQAGFQKIDARKSWHWQDRSIWIYDVRAIGNYFSQVTGWPPGSVGVWLSVYFTFAPQPAGMKLDKLGRWLPPEHMGHMRMHLDCRLDQSRLVRHFSNPTEQRRTDLWWVDPDGENADEVAGDIAVSLFDQGLPWFRNVSDPRTALELVTADPRGSLIKFQKAAFLARELGDEEAWRSYDYLAEAEAVRLGRSTDRAIWYGI